MRSGVRYIRTNWPARQSVLGPALQLRQEYRQARRRPVLFYVDQQETDANIGCDSSEPGHNGTKSHRGPTGEPHDARAGS